VRSARYKRYFFKGKTMKKLTLSTALIAVFAAGLVQAGDKTPDNDMSLNAAITSDYRYRGIS